MDDQTESALRADGDGYHTRNYAGIGTIADPAFDEVSRIASLQPITTVLEIGCTTGFRLEKIRQAFGSSCAGLEASRAAIQEGRSRFPEVQLEHGLAPRDLSLWDGGEFDLVIVGHFLYLLPREDVFALAAEVDRLVNVNGHIIVMDFLHPLPMSAPYAHHPDLRVYKADPSAPWLWSPTYTLVSRRVYEVAEHAEQCLDPRAWQTVDVIRKLDVETAYPQIPTLPSVHADE